MKANFDKEKALQALLYISQQAPRPDSIHLLKIIYFAEKEHLQRYGRMILHDDYKKRPYGAVPTRVYDLIKAIRGRGDSHFLDTNPEYVQRVVSVLTANGPQSDTYIRPLQEPDLDVLSPSDLNCLIAAIQEIGPLSFDELVRKCHEEDEAWNIVQGDDISIEAIASTLPDSEALLEYIKETS